MTLLRTAAGLRNLALLYRVDKVVFVEGGSTDVTVETAMAGTYSSNTCDTRYWSILFAHFCPGNYQFRSVSSKTTLLALLARLGKEACSTVIFAMDRDYDNFNGRLVRKPSVIYTYGYGWENEVWCLPVIQQILDQFLLAPMTKSQIDYLHALHAKFAREISRALEIHVTLSLFDQSLFSGCGFGGIADQSSLLVRKDQIRRLLQSAKTLRTQPIFRRKRRRISFERDFPCHLKASLAHHMFFTVYKHCCGRKPTISADLLDGFAITTFASVIVNDRKSPTYKHYQRQFSRLSAT